jgi:hypothetical protein
MSENVGNVDSAAGLSHFGSYASSLDSALSAKQKGTGEIPALLWLRA